MIHLLIYFVLVFFVLAGVRISAFVSSDDKKPMQKSIIGFLQQGKIDSHDSIPVSEKYEDHVDNHGVQTRPLPCPEPVQVPQKAEEVSLWRKLKGSEAKTSDEKPQQSFFQRAHAQRLKLQEINANRPEDNASAELPHDLQQFDGLAADLHEVDNCSPLTEAVASTSGCGSKVSKSFDCPVCFRSVETNDLNVFNRHIDWCLSDASKNPDRRTGSDAESDLDQENHHSKGESTVELGEVVAEVSDPTGVDHKEDPPTRRNASCTSAPVNNDADKISPNLQTSISKGHVLVCPICQLSQNNADLVVFNQHVDLCLNQEAISHLEGETPSVTSSRSFGECVFACFIFFESCFCLTFSSGTGQGRGNWQDLQELVLASETCTLSKHFLQKCCNDSLA